MDTPNPLPDEILDYYNRGLEADRLFKGIGPLELARTQELIARYFPPSPAIVLDIGGGPGIYSSWLALAGYEVHLIDAIPLHVEQAKLVSMEQPALPITSIVLGDARQLDHPDASVDAVLLHGPLYHLITRDDRIAALVEAKRTLRQGGVLLAIGITRFASALVGLIRNWLGDDSFFEMVRRELTDGQHKPPSSWPDLFTTAFFHHPRELGAEIEAVGLSHEITLAIEGPGWIALENEAIWDDERQRERILALVRMVEGEEPLLGMSPHLMGVARNPYTY